MLKFKRKFRRLKVKDALRRSLKVIRDALLWTGSDVETSRCGLTGGRGEGSLSDACLNITDLLVRFY